MPDLVDYVDYLFDPVAHGQESQFDEFALQHLTVWPHKTSVHLYRQKPDHSRKNKDKENIHVTTTGKVTDIHRRALGINILQTDYLSSSSLPSEVYNHKIHIQREGKI